MASEHSRELQFLDLWTLARTSISWPLNIRENFNFLTSKHSRELHSDLWTFAWTSLWPLNTLENFKIPWPLNTLVNFTLFSYSPNTHELERVFSLICCGYLISLTWSSGWIDRFFLTFQSIGTGPLITSGGWSVIIPRRYFETIFFLYGITWRQIVYLVYDSFLDVILSWLCLYIVLMILLNIKYCQYSECSYGLFNKLIFKMELWKKKYCTVSFLGPPAYKSLSSYRKCLWKWNSHVVKIVIYFAVKL